MMQLDRNMPDNQGLGKYALLKLRRLSEYRSNTTFEAFSPEIQSAITLLEKEDILDWGEANSEAEFFVIRLKDRYAQDALVAYAHAARSDSPEWAEEIDKLADRAGPANRWCKFPD